MPTEKTKLRALGVRAALLGIAMAVLVVAVVGQRGRGAAAPNPVPQGPLSQLHFRFLGPDGNRDIAVVGVPGNSLVAYFGAASGGIWKTDDAGAHYTQVFEGQNIDVSSVSALAIAPSNPNIVWAGTGETFIIREATSVGDGIYKSTDAGRTWQHMGLPLTGHIGNIAINPTNPDIVFACAVGQAYKPNPERGVYRSEDGGQTWKQVLKGANDYTGCSGLDMDPHDPNTLFAGMWQVDIKPWNENSGGPGSGVFVSHDGGDTWTRLAGNGLPPAGADLGKIAVRVAPSDPQRVYALIQEKTSDFYRSNDGGRTWTLVNQSHKLNERSPYYTNFRVSPDNPDLLYFVSVSWTVSRDGGRTFAQVTSPGGDLHDVWIDPKNPQRIMVADDGGGAISLDGGRTYLTVNLPIAQIYHVYTDTNIPYNVIGNRQDSGGEEGPSRLLTGGGRGGRGGGRGGGISAAEWHAYAGCESGFGVPDPVDPDIIWSGCYNGDLVRVDLHTGQSHNVSVWPVASFGAAPAEVRDRWNWTFPIAISPHNHEQVYVGSQYVYQTNDKGQSWKRISPDLTTNDKTKEGNSGGLAYDNLMTFDAATLAMIDESPVKAGVIWTGSYDGQVNVTQDGGAHWTNVTRNITGMPPWGTINVQASPHDAATAYVTSNIKMMGDYNPYIFKTTDYGKTWTNISGDIPHTEFSFVHVVREDPVRKGMLYAGTENAIYISWNDGGHWQQIRNDLPPAPMYWLEIQPRFNDLVIATYGRGIWILDDVSPLRSWDQVSNAGRPHLFNPQPAYRFRTDVATPQEAPNSPTVGEDAPYGADINFYLPNAGPTTLTISDASGKVIRTLKQEGQVGLNRVYWDLRHESRHEALMLTNPPGEPWVNTPPEGRALITWGQPPAAGPKVTPGNFTVKLEAGGSVVGSAPLQVLIDPHTLGTQQSMAAEEQFALQLQDEINTDIDLINRLERVRKQLQSGAHANLEQTAEQLEGRLVDVYNTGFTEDSFREPPGLYEELGSLATNIDGAGADLAPTTEQIQANDDMKARLNQAQQAINTFLNQARAAGINVQ